jgi:hypothetical protein
MHNHLQLLPSFLGYGKVNGATYKDIIGTGSLYNEVQMILCQCLFGMGHKVRDVIHEALSCEIVSF